MPDSIPNLAGVATKDLVETIGAGSFKASYINWSRTMQLLRDNAPGWTTELKINEQGECLFRQPVGAVIYLRCVHVDGTALPWVNQAVMDHRNNAIPFDKITARDVTDTERRGSCMVVAKQLGLAHELWAKMPLESGYGDQETIPVGSASNAPSAATEAPQAASKQPSKEDFLAACLDKGLSTHAADKLLEIIGTNYAGAIKTLANKTEDWVAEQNTQAEPAPKQSKPAAKKSGKADPEDY